MTHKQMILEMCEKMGLTRQVKNNEGWYDCLGREQYRVFDDSITLGSGDEGYAHCSVTFRFDDLGNILSHEVIDDR